MKNKSHFKGFILFQFLIWSFSSGLFAQRIESNLIYKFSTEQGLSNNTIYSILQDEKGLIWIATEEGLNKFDGKNFTHFSINKGRYSLTHNRTQTALLAPDGNIWIGTSDGLNIYDYKSDSIIKVRDNSLPYKLVYNDITVLTSSKNNNKTWIGTYGNGVNYFDWRKMQFAALSIPTLPSISAPQKVMSLLEDDNNRLWIGTQNNGLYRYNIAERKLDFYDLPMNGRNIRSIYQDSFRRIWVGTSKGCYIYNETTNQLVLVTYPYGLSSNSIGVIKEDHSGKIWIGTELFLMNFSVRSFSMSEKFPFQTINQGESTSRLSCPSINTLFADQDNNIWIGTAWGGVNMLKGTTTKFKLIKHDSETPNTLPNSPITAICSDKSGNLLIATMGTDKVGLCKMNLQNDEIRELSINRKLPGYVYQAIFEDSQSNLWLGTYNKGLIKVDKNGSNFREYVVDNKNPNSIPSNDIRCIYEGKNQNIWIGTSNGLVNYNNKTEILSHIDIYKKQIVGIRTIKEDAYGTLWIGTYGAGVITYNYIKKNVNLRPTNLDIRVVSDILIVGDSIWLCTQGEGLHLYIPKNKRTSSFTETKGLSSNYISSISRDNAGKIWVGTSKGISRIDPKTKEIENFSAGDGIQSREFSERSTVVLSSGLIAFGGFGGINIFNPMNVTKNDKCPPVIFTKLLVFNEISTPSEDKYRFSPLKQNITLADKIDLKYDQSVFTIEFMGINYNANQKIQYAYFLEGSDKKWNQLGNQNSVTFRNLQPGKYVFKVKASSPDAVWNEKNMASIIINIRPPFWASGWAYFIYLILLGTLLYFIWLFFNIRIQTANKIKIEGAKREKEEELHQEKLQFFTNISHEFRTPLTLIIGPLEKMQFDELNDDKKSHLKLMLRNANRLLSMVNQLLDFRKTERGQMKLKVQNQDIILVIKEIMLSFEELRIQKNIQFEFINDVDNLMAWFDAEFLTKSLFNLLSNAFKFTGDGGFIKLSVLTRKDVFQNNELIISLTDNGKGIHPSDIESIFDRFYQGKEKSNMQQGSGIGLHLVKNLIELHHGKIEVESTQNIKTTFKLTLPIDENAYLEEELFNPIELKSMTESVETKAEEKLVVKDLKSEDNVKKMSCKRILIVEDNAEIRTYIRSILEPEYGVEEAENGAIGLEMIALHEYDLIISDLMMPEIDGIEMCKQLKKSIETDHIPIILLTAKSDIENKIEGLSIGADSYITKPFHPQHLTVRVSKLIELRELLKERYSRKISLGDLHKSDLSSASPDELFLQKAISIILNKMIETEFNGDALAYQLSISRMGLHRKIKALTGQSTGEFIRNIRLKKACELLCVNGKNISEVCYDVGFNSPSYFATCFTEVYKMTPTEYVRSVKTQNAD